MFALNLIFDGVIKEIIGTIMGLQVVIHMVLFMLPYPGNMHNFM
jgi:hypothetical protein